MRKLRLLLSVMFAGLLALGAACAGEKEVSFEMLDDDRAAMTGLIGSSTPDALRDLLDDHPQLATIVMVDVPGSDDDKSNLEAARLVRAAGLTTHVPATGVIASGGVDFYLAGANRTREPGARFGVHSWAAGDGRTGADIDDDDPSHDLYIDYYDEMGVDPDFYWFTLDAAPAESVHFMTESELVNFDFGSIAGG